MSSPATPHLHLTREQHDSMLNHIRLHEHEEACGLVAGRQGQAHKIYPVDNALHSPTRFRMDPAQQVKAFLDMENSGLELLAVYHSHLHGPAQPSETDTKEFAYPGVIYLIFDLSKTDPVCRGFSLLEGQWSEVQLTISDK